MATLITAARLVTCAARGGDPLGAAEPGALLSDGERIAAVGDPIALAEQFPAAERIDHPGLITPGLVDAHTHAAWMGSRASEYALRMQGADYETIAAAGGGIVATMRAVRDATAEAIERELGARLGRMAALGVTTIEVKSGYGLSEAAERKQLEAIARAAENPRLPRVVPTFLGLHAVPPEFSDRASYARACTAWLDGIAAERLARFVDAYLDRQAFSVEEARPFLERARELGLGVRLHVGQFADVGGAELAAKLGARSVDHLENGSPSAIAALAEAGVAACLLPVASYTLHQAPPDIAALREAQVAIVVASDSNPGTAPTESLPLAMAMAAREYRLTLAEIVLGVTARSARSLDSDGGVLQPGAPSDFVLWDVGHEAELIQPWGVPKARAAYRGGRRIVG